MKSFWLILHLLFIIGTVHPQSDDGGDVCNLAECQCVTVGNIFRATCECNSLKHKVMLLYYMSFPQAKDKDIFLEIKNCESALFYDPLNMKLKQLTISSVEHVSLNTRGALKMIDNIRIEDVDKLEIDVSVLDDVNAEEVMFNNVTFSVLERGTFSSAMKVKLLVFNDATFTDVRRGAFNTSSTVQFVAFDNCRWVRMEEDSVWINSSSFEMRNDIFGTNITQRSFNIGSPTITLIQQHSPNVSSYFNRRIAVGDSFIQTYPNVTNATEIMTRSAGSSPAKWLSIFNMGGKAQKLMGECSCHLIEKHSLMKQNLTCPSWKMLRETLSDKLWQKSCKLTVSSSTRCEYFQLYLLTLVIVSYLV